MEPTLAGDRTYFHCPNCGHDAYFSPTVTSDLKPNCPQCHWPVRLRQSEHGQQIEYEKTDSRHPLQVGDLVVFRYPSTDQRLQVKRVASGPGQVVQIFDGDLFLDGKRQYTSLSQFRRRAVPISKTRLVCENDSQNWLAYHPSSLYPRSGADFIRHASSLTDESPWDLSESRRFAAVSDFGVRLRFSSASPKLIVNSRLWYHGITFEISVDYANQTVNGSRLFEIGQSATASETLDTNPRSVKTAADSAWLHEASQNREHELIIGIVDGFLRVGMPNEVYATRIADDNLRRSNTQPDPYCLYADEVEHEGSLSKTALGFITHEQDDLHLSWLAPLAVQIKSETAISGSIEVFRDVHYRGPLGELDYTLDATEGYQVLGDHVAGSLDSRQTYRQGIPRDSILGRVRLD